MSFYDMRAKFRPIDTWPAAETKSRQWAPFRASWSQTTELLGRELRHLNAKNILCLMALRERDIRLDGYPRADARPSHPGVILAFDSIHGPLKYACDRFTDWQDNVRAIALGLEALRKVERYGITKRGEQYVGWRALASGTEPVMTVETAARVVADFAYRLGGGPHAYGAASRILESADELKARYREAARGVHPDSGGSTKDFQRLQEAKRILDAHHKPEEGG
jgi:hypothetical protein